MSADGKRTLIGVVLLPALVQGRIDGDFVVASVGDAGQRLELFGANAEPTSLRR